MNFGTKCVAKTHTHSLTHTLCHTHTHSHIHLWDLLDHGAAVYPELVFAKILCKYCAFRKVNKPGMCLLCACVCSVYLLPQGLSGSQTGAGGHKPAVSQLALVQVMSADSIHEQMWVSAQILQEARTQPGIQLQTNEAKQAAEEMRGRASARGSHTH